MKPSRAIVDGVAILVLALLMLALLAGGLLLVWYDSAVALDLITPLVAAGGALLSAIVAFLIRGDVQTVHLLINSRMTELLALTEQRAAAEATLVERAAAKAAAEALAARQQDIRREVDDDQ